MSVQGMTRTLIRVAQPTTARKSSSRSAGETCFESFSERERADAVVAQTVVVEQHARDDERPRERPAPGLVRARDEAGAELAIVGEELLAARARHGLDCSPPCGRQRNDFVAA